MNITYGSASGPAGTTGVTQNSGSVPGTSEKGDGFGWDLDMGDVNGDGYQDLVVSAPDEDIDGVTNTGMVTVLYGSAAASTSPPAPRRSRRAPRASPATTRRATCSARTSSSTTSPATAGPT